MAQLEKKHVFLSFERRINPASLGYPLMAFISVHVQQQKLGTLAVELAGIPEILEGYGLTGSADLLLRVVALDAEDLFRINGKILACDGVDRTDTALAMGELIPFRIQPAAGTRVRRHLTAGPTTVTTGKYQSFRDVDAIGYSSNVDRAPACPVSRSTAGAVPERPHL